MVQRNQGGGRHRVGNERRGQGDRPGSHRASARRSWAGTLTMMLTAAVSATAVIATMSLLPQSTQDRAGAAVDPVVAQPEDSGTAPAPQQEPTIQARPRIQRGVQLQSVPRPASRAVPVLPEDSGTGRRVVFSETDQRVWLVEDNEQVVRSYLVSGSIYENLFPGTYAVYSRSLSAFGIDDSGTMEYFVRFTKGTGGSAIGFHDIPVDDGVEVQSVDELGTPLSHGCIRQAEPDAIALWEFAQLDTTVVVTA